MNCGVPFYERVHIRGLMNYLKFLSNPSNPVVFWCIFETAAGIGPQTARKMFQSFSGHSCNLRELALLKIPRKSAKDFNAIVSCLQSGFAALENGADIESLLKIYYNGYFRNYLMRAYDHASFLKREKDVATLFQMVGAYKDLTDYLSQITLDPGEKEESAGKVLISTIHKAKGLEWDKVFLPFMNDGVLPHVRAVQDEEYEEDRRLLYVAITRARKELDIIHVRNVQDKEHFDPNISPFLENVPGRDFLRQTA